MDVLAWIFDFISLQMPDPHTFGFYHILWLVLTVELSVLLCVLYKRGKIKSVSRTVLAVSLFVVALEIFKQFYYNFSYDGEIHFEYQWFIFPWQFCSMPMYVGVLAGLTRGKLQKALYNFLATFAMFAGLCVMIYPEQVFTMSVWINIQTMLCHASMIVIGVFLFYTGAVKAEHKTVLGGVAVFSVAVAIAVGLNELACLVGIVPDHTFNMFFVSRHCEPSLPVYSTVQGLVPYPWCLLIYILGFGIAAYLVLLTVMLIKKIATAKKVA